MNSPTQTLPAPAECAPYASPAVLGLSIRQLREWEAMASRQLVVSPKPEAEAWEDTDMDVRRTVL